MSSYRGLSFRYLKQQRKRTLLTLAGIVLSVALLCAAGIMGESLKNTLKENVKQRYGDFHVSYEELDMRQVQKLQKNIKVDGVGYVKNIGFDFVTKTQKLILSACNKEYLDMIGLRLSSGRLPENNNEAVLEQWVIDNMDHKPSLGDSFEMKFKLDGLPEDSSAASNDKKNSSAADGSVTRQFKLVGIFKNTDGTQVNGMSLCAVTPGTAMEILKTDNLRYGAAVRIKEGLDYQAVIKELNSILAIDSKKVYQNIAVLSTESQGMNNNINRAVFIAQLIMVLVIIIATIAVIFNSFQISVLERIHQFGVLRSVGATPGQINKLVLGEALMLAGTAIPLGLACGVLGVKAVIGLFSLQSSNYFGGMQVIIHLNTILLTAFLGLVTILLSAFGPALTASRVSPLEAILNRTKASASKLKTRKYFPARLFRVEGVMAGRNLGRNRKRLFVTVFSMCIGIVLFIFFSSCIDMFNSETELTFRKDFTLDKPFSSDKPGFSEKDYADAAAIPGVRTVYRLMQRECSVLLSEKQTTKEYRDAVGGKSRDNTCSLGNGPYYRQPAAFYGYRKLELELCKKNVIRGRLDVNELNRYNGVLISQSFYAKEKDNSIQASDLEVGDEILLYPDTAAATGENPVKLKVAGILDKMPFVYTGDYPLYGLITTEEVFKKITGVNTYTRFDIEINKNAQKNLIKAKLSDIKANVEEGRLLEFSGSDMQTQSLQFSVILYGLVTIISIIGALNIINTISTNLILRIREFGTLRAVGMEPGQMKRMIMLEGIYYGTLASFYGSIAGCLISRVLYNYMNTVKTISWHIPWQAALEACIAAVMIGLLASLVPLKRIVAMNITESIRAEE